MFNKIEGELRVSLAMVKKYKNKYTRPLLYGVIVHLMEKKCMEKLDIPLHTISRLLDVGVQTLEDAMKDLCIDGYIRMRSNGNRNQYIITLR